MSETIEPAPTLFDLLARDWPQDAPVASAVFNADQSAAAFARADGGLAIARLADDEPPSGRVRVQTDTGRMTIHPRARPVPAATVVSPLAERDAPLAPCGPSGFAVGGGDGRVYRVTPRGQVLRTGLALEEPVAAVAAAPEADRLAAAGGRMVALLDVTGEHVAERMALDSPVAALAFAPDGATLAAAQDAGLALWTPGAGTRSFRTVAVPGRPRGISWSPCGGWIACPLAGGGFHLVRLADGEGDTVSGYPAPVGAIDWSAGADALVTAGAFRTVAWSMAAPPLGGETRGALSTGRPGLVLVERVAARPTGDLIAVGFASGLVTVAQLGRPDELILRAEGGGVTALSWSADGAHLAIGAADGMAAIASFPPQMFKCGARLRRKDRTDERCPDR